MENNVVIFTPLGHKTVDENLEVFIDLAKNKLTLWGKDLDWDALSWNISGYYERRGHTANENINWTNHKSCNRNIIAKVSIQEPLLSFAKSYIRYTQSISKRKTIREHLACFRFLEIALLQSFGIADVKHISPQILNNTVDLLKENYKDPDQISTYLVKIYDFLCENKLCYITMPWKRKIYGTYIPQSAGKDFEKYSLAKCPSHEALMAVAKIFNEPKDDIDRLVTGILVIMLAQPCRISEVLTLPYDCEVENWSGQNTYGLRWEPAKGGQDLVKEILPKWVDVVKEAISRIKKITDQGRSIALRYENNTEKFFYVEKISRNRGQEYIKVSDLPELFSVSFKALWDHIKNVKRYTALDLGINIKDAHKYKFVSCHDLNEHMRSKLPPKFPEMRKDQNYSESLFVVNNSFFKPNLSSAHCNVMFEPIFYTQIQGALGCDKKVFSIFNKHDVFENDGQRIAYNTHSSRHWQNNLMHKNDVSNFLIALYSGRKSVSQNQAYNHVTQKQYADKAKEALAGTSLLPSIRKCENEISVYERTEIINSKLKESFGAAHVTDVGFCIRDTVSMPCRKMLDHATCSDHLYVKGDPRNHLLRKEAQEERQLLDEIALEEEGEPLYGADVWYTQRLQRLKILESVLQGFDNDLIPAGALFRPVLNNEYDPLKIAVYNRTKVFNDVIEDKIQLELISTIDLENE